LSSALNEERRRQAGISEWQWIHSSKRHPREEHVARDRKLYTDDPSKIGREYEGKVIMKAPPTRPGEEINCGCTSKAVLILE